MEGWWRHFKVVIKLHNQHLLRTSFTETQWWLPWVTRRLNKHFINAKKLAVLYRVDELTWCFTKQGVPNELLLLLEIRWDNCSLEFLKACSRMISIHLVGLLIRAFNTTGIANMSSEKINRGDFRPTKSSPKGKSKHPQQKIWVAGHAPALSELQWTSSDKTASWPYSIEVERQNLPARHSWYDHKHS